MTTPRQDRGPVYVDLPHPGRKRRVLLAVMAPVAVLIAVVVYAAWTLL